MLMMLYVAGSEAMFADLCYFSVRSIQVMELENLVAESSGSRTSFYKLYKLYLICVIVVICSLHLCFSYCLVYCWVIWVKQHTLL